MHRKLISGFMMVTAFQRIQADRGMNLVFYILAPASFFTGELMLILLLAFARLIPRWTGWIAAIGFTGIGLAVATNNVIVFLLGFAGLALGPMRVGWQTLLDSPPRRQPAAQPGEGTGSRRHGVGFEGGNKHE